MTESDYDQRRIRKQRTLRIVTAVVAGIAALGMVLPMLGGAFA